MSQNQQAPVPVEYSDLTIEGWRDGFKKISFTHLLQREAGLGLGDAKHITDKVVDGQQVRVKIPTHRRDSFIDEAKALGVRDVQID